MAADTLLVFCPGCGARNRREAVFCRLCGQALRPDEGGKKVQRKALRRTDFLAAAHANQRKTVLLVMMLLLIAAVLGYFIGWNLELLSATRPSSDLPPSALLSPGGVHGALLLLVLAAVWSYLALRSGDRMVLSLCGARPLADAEEAQLHNVVEEMAVAAGLPKPRVYLLETEAMNAFAAGSRPDRAVICITRGLLKYLKRDELQGVIGHEMGHIVNNDIRYATAVASLVGIIALVSDGIRRSLRYGAARHWQRGLNPAALTALLLLAVFSLIAPLSALLVQMAVSRQREFLADATSVRLTRDPSGLVSALERLDRTAQPFPGANRATQHMFIVNPLRGFPEEARALFATHPPIRRRIQRLLSLGAHPPSATVS
jgi:heat shock protein HtpX